MSEEAGPVLFCFDGSDSSATAIAVAERLLARRKALVCHVWVGLSRDVLFSDPAELPGALREAAEELDRADEEAAAELAAEGAQLALAAGFDAQPLPERRRSKAWRTLLATADRHEASVVVAGAHGRSGFGRAVLGSVSTSLLHHATRPVLVIPAVAPPEGTEGPLLLCYDGSEPSRRAIKAAGELCAVRRVLVLNFWESWVAEAPGLAGASKTVHAMAAELDEVADQQSAGRMKEGVELARQAGFDAEGISERAAGPAWKAVLDTAADHDCAGIVVGSRGLNGISAVLGSVSNGIVHHSRRAVLVVPPQQATR